MRVLREEDCLTLDFPIQRGTRCESSEALIDGLGVEPIECYRPSEYLALLGTSTDVAGLVPDFRVLETLDLHGVIVTAHGESKDFVSRFFAPKSGIDEDPATGSAHCTLSLYWADKTGKDILTATFCITIKVNMYLLIHYNIIQI